MKTVFLRKSAASNRLVLVFTGWSTDSLLFESLPERVPKEWDILVASDYNDFSFPAQVLANYSTIYLFAWSLGVEAAERSLPSSMLTKAFAINGTPMAVSNNYGIPVEIFEGTARNLSPKSLKKFQLRMAGKPTSFKTLEPLLPDNPDIFSLRDQLNLFLSAAENTITSVTLPWCRVYVSLQDLIFPPDAQKACWSAFSPSSEIICLNTSHYPDIIDIIVENIPDSKGIGQQFASALPTYSANASAQRNIAIRLLELLKQFAPGHGMKILEIGPGSGIFTSLYTSVLNPSEATFIDLYPLKPFNIASKENYHATDAEEWLHNTDEQFDIILSTSVIQWFSNPARFFRNAFRVLRPGGILAVSTFLPGNLHELDTIRTSPIIYPDRNTLESWLNSEFKDTFAYTEDIILEFESAREAILHLKRTGVTGPRRQESQSGSLSSMPRNINGKVTLTFRPFYIIARKP